MNFLSNGLMLNTILGDESNVIQYNYSVTGNKLKLVDNNNVEANYRIHLAGDQMTMVGHNFSRVYTRQASTESE